MPCLQFLFWIANGRIVTKIFLAGMFHTIKASNTAKRSKKPAPLYLFPFHVEVTKHNKLHLTW